MSIMTIMSIINSRNTTEIIPDIRPKGYIGADSHNSLCANCTGQCNCKCVCGGGRNCKLVPRGVSA